MFCIVFESDIGIVFKVFASGPGDKGSILGRDIPKTQNIVLDASLINTQQYKERIKGVKQSREGSSVLSYTLCVEAIEKGAFSSPLTKLANFNLYLYIYIFHK